MGHNKIYLNVEGVHDNTSDINSQKPQDSKGLSENIPIILLMKNIHICPPRAFGKSFYIPSLFWIRFYPTWSEYTTIREIIYL